LTGANVGERNYRALAPAGRAVLKAADYLPPPEGPNEDYPLVFSTGRTAYHFHTRTKTARTPQLNAAAPAPWVEISAPDAARIGVTEGDWVEIASPRGRVLVPARISEVRPGTVLMPFHYGYFDIADGAGPDGTQARAANEITLTEWDPVSKQPVFKVAAVSLRKVRSGSAPAPAPTTTASRPVSDGITPTLGGPAAQDSGELTENDAHRARGGVR
jgi:anaerobic selenocysteine-containing dehydrogenase